MKKKITVKFIINGYIGRIIDEHELVENKPQRFDLRTGKKNAYSYLNTEGALKMILTQKKTS